MSFWTYILRCADGTYYTGHTDDLERRIARHQSGELTGYTQERRRLEVAWHETFQTRAEALDAELRIKNWSRAKKEALIAGNFKQLKAASIPPSERTARASTSFGSPPRLRSGRTEVESSVPTQDERGNDAGFPPAIILVRPQLGENIGKAARAMLNFGLTDLRLVAPRDGWPNPDAGPAASGADIVLEQAQVFDSVADAIADCTHVYATTVRKRGVTKPVVSPAEAAQAIHADPGRSAILFGPERSGLESDDVAIARTIITVPINPRFGSLNLAQAVILCAYEWSKGVSLAQPPATDLAPPAPQEELEGFLGQLDAMLEKAGYFFPPDRIATSKRTVRTLLTKPGWDAQEVRTLRGILSAIEKPQSR